MPHPTAHSSNTYSGSNSTTYSGSNSTCVWHQQNHCLAPHHAITSQNECYNQEQLNSGVCDEYVTHCNTVSAVTQTLGSHIEAVAKVVATHLGM